MVGVLFTAMWILARINFGFTEHRAIIGVHATYKIGECYRRACDLLDFENSRRTLTRVKNWLQGERMSQLTSIGFAFWEGILHFAKLTRWIIIHFEHLYSEVVVALRASHWGFRGDVVLSRRHVSGFVLYAKRLAGEPEPHHQIVDGSSVSPPRLPVGGSNSQLCMHESGRSTSGFCC